MIFVWSTAVNHVKMFQQQEPRHQHEDLHNRCADSSQSAAMWIVGSCIQRYGISLSNCRKWIANKPCIGVGMKITIRGLWKRKEEHIKYAEWILQLTPESFVLPFE